MNANGIRCRTGLHDWAENRVLIGGKYWRCRECHRLADEKRERRSGRKRTGPYDTPKVKRADRLEDYECLVEAGLSDQDIAAKFGIKVESLWAFLYRCGLKPRHVARVTR